MEARAKVLVIGAGPAGICVATGLASRGIKPNILIDRGERIGGVPSLYRTKLGGVLTFVLWSKGHIVFGEELVDHLVHKLRGAKVAVRLETQATKVSPEERIVTLMNPVRGRCQVSADWLARDFCGRHEYNV